MFCSALCMCTLQIYTNSTFLQSMKVKLLSRVRLFATPWAVAYEAAPSMGFSSKSTGVGCHFLLQGIFPTRGVNPRLLRCRQTLYWLATREAQEQTASSKHVWEGGSFNFLPGKSVRKGRRWFLQIVKQSRLLCVQVSYRCVFFTQ